MRLVKYEVRKGSYGKIRNRGQYSHTSLVGTKTWMRVIHPTIKESYYEIDCIVYERVHENVVKPLQNMLQ